MPLDAILLDLDGTLVDSAPGIRRCADLALEEIGRPPLTDAQLAAFIGPPLPMGFASVGIEPSMIDEIVTIYRSHYRAGGVLEFEVYDGIHDTLPMLRDRGLRLCVATSKITEFARQVIDHAGLEHHFDLVLGAEFDGTRGSKAEVIADVLELSQIAGPHLALMIGDREHDGHGAAATEVRFIGAGWGYGSHTELTAAGAGQIAGHPTDLLAIIDSLG